MFEFERYSIEVTDAGYGAVLLDYGSFALAEAKGRKLSARKPNRMVNIIEWDSTKRQSTREWVLARGKPPIAYNPSTTCH